LEIGGTAEVETEWGGDDAVFEGGGVYECLIAEEESNRTGSTGDGGMFVNWSGDGPPKRFGRVSS